MDTNQYDVVIVGSGIAGAIIAKTLTHAGKKVLMLEAGLDAGMALDTDKAYENYQSYLNRYYNAQAKVPNAPYPFLKDAPAPSVLDIAPIKDDKPSDVGYFVQKGPVPFASDYNRSPGGTTLHWLGTCLRMLPNDFRMKSTYGQAVDWPISYEDLKPYYEMAELEIGVSADVGEQVYPNTGPDFFGKEYVFPMYKIPQSYLDNNFIKGLGECSVDMNGSQYKVWTVSTPQGRNSDPNKKYRNEKITWNSEAGRLQFTRFAKDTDTYNPVGSIWDPYTGQRCEGNASCVPICPVQAKYNALKTIKSSLHKNLTIVTQAVATKVLFDSTNGQITAIEYKHYKNPSSFEYELKKVSGKLFVLAASAIENAKLLLASQMPNTSKQIGRNLMDHTVMLTWGLMKDKVFPYRGPGSTTNIPSFRDGSFRSEHSAWISPIDNWGWAWPTFAPGSDLSAAIAPPKDMFGSELKKHLSNTVPRQLLLHFECEQLPEAVNNVTIDNRYLDNLGNYRPVISYTVSDYIRKAFKAGKNVSDQIFKKLGVEDFTFYNPQNADYVTYDGKGYVFAGAGHTVGTHCMGTTRKNSVVDKHQRCWDHQNLFLAGAGNMATLGTSNPTLTLAALAFSAAENILKDLK
jgi:choline dehydrogenase-like flavoprotein